MEKENKRLQAAVKDLQAPARTTTRKNVEAEEYQVPCREELVASSSPTRPPSPMKPSRPSMKRNFFHLDADESLSIEMPSFEDSTEHRGLLPLSPMPSASGPSRGRQHPTARTYTYDTGSKPLLDQRKKSKYFPGQHDKISSRLSGDITNELATFIGSDDDDEPRVLIPATSSPHRAPDLNMSRTNPFQTTRLESVAKTDAKFKRKPMETIEIGDSDGDSPLRPSDTNVSTSKAETAPIKKPTSTLGKTPSKIQYLGLVDRNGRPVKNVASGSKVKRRA